MASLNVQCRFGVLRQRSREPAACRPRGPCAQRATSENRPSSAPGWCAGSPDRTTDVGFPTPRWARTSWEVTSNCQRETNHWRISTGAASRSVQRKACGGNSLSRSRTSSQRRSAQGASRHGVPKTAVLMAISTTRLVRPYQSVTQCGVAKPCRHRAALASVWAGACPLDRRSSTRPGRLGGAGAMEIGVEAQSGDDADIILDVHRWKSTAANAVSPT